MFNSKSAESKLPKTGLVLDTVFTQHVTQTGHPESAERVRVIQASLSRESLPERCSLVAPRSATDEEILSNHSREYLDRVIEACLTEQPFIDCVDSSICPESIRIARLAAGSVINAIDRVMSGELMNAFCVVRPPGHHAEYDRSIGFCLFNNVAIAARHLIEHHGLRRVLVLDWDVHHGNGTQRSFENDSRVMVCNMHGAPPFYPGDIGFETERGVGQGLGFTLNMPLKEGSGVVEYRKAFQEIFLPAARGFKPEFVLVSAGFDAHKDDPLGCMKLPTEFFAELTGEVCAFSKDVCSGRVVSVLEGGYNLKALGECAVVHLKGLLKSGEGV